VTFVNAIATLSDRFLTERAFELIVGPALADFEFDDNRRLSHYTGVIAAFAGAFWDDAVRGNVATFAGLVAIPACYYFFFFLLGLPKGILMPDNLITTLGIAVVTLSLAPAIVCFWPDRPPRKRSTES
jgi:hypothetical protein